jgi:uncharacterized Zn-finger protein
LHGKYKKPSSLFFLDQQIIFLSFSVLFSNFFLCMYQQELQQDHCLFTNDTNNYVPFWCFDDNRHIYEQDYMLQVQQDHHQQLLLSTSFFPVKQEVVSDKEFDNHSYNSTKITAFTTNNSSCVSPSSSFSSLSSSPGIEQSTYATNGADILEEIDLLLLQAINTTEVTLDNTAMSIGCTSIDPVKVEQSPASTIYSKSTFSCQKQQLRKPFACYSCSRSFARKYDLQRHARCHSGVKPYSCLNCTKAFARTDALKRHLRVEEKCRMSPVIQAMKEAGNRRYRNL